MSPKSSVPQAASFVSQVLMSNILRLGLDEVLVFMGRRLTPTIRARRMVATERTGLLVYSMAGAVAKASGTKYRRHLRPIHEPWAPLLRLLGTAVLASELVESLARLAD